MSSVRRGALNHLDQLEPYIIFLIDAIQPAAGEGLVGICINEQGGTFIETPSSLSFKGNLTREEVNMLLEQDFALIIHLMFVIIIVDSIYTYPSHGCGADVESFGDPAVAIVHEIFLTFRVVTVA